MDVGKFKYGKLSIIKDVNISDVVLKLPDVFYGIGDKFLKRHEDFDTNEDLEQLILEDKEMRYLVF